MVVNTTDINYSKEVGIGCSALKEIDEFIFKTGEKNSYPFVFLYQYILALKYNQQNRIFYKIIEMKENKKKRERISSLCSSNCDIELCFDDIYNLTKSFCELKNNFDYSFFSCGYYHWENFAEITRNRVNPNAPSRFDSYFLFEDYQNAKNYKEQFFHDYIIVKAQPVKIDKIASYDLDIWNEQSQDLTFDKLIEQYKRYWTNKPKTNSEVLFQGKIKLFN